MSSSKNNSSSIGFFGLLAIVFITLKLIGYITWSWWWVLGPLWMPLAVVISCGIIYLIVYVLFHLFTDK